MACILHIETSTDVCSVALSKDGYLLWEKTGPKGLGHAELLGTYVDEALHKAEEKQLTVEAVAVSSGPGSYTGLRIGVSMAKGVCYGSGARLVAVPTLQVLCVPVLLGDRLRCSTWVDGREERMDCEMEDDALLCPMIDARRMEVYAAVYDRRLRERRATSADVVTPETYLEMLNRGVVYFFGNGAEKCRSVINHPNARYIIGVEPLAKHMMPLADMRMMRGETEDVAYFVPTYFKDYVAKKPKPMLMAQGGFY